MNKNLLMAASLVTLAHSANVNFHWYADTNTGTLTAEVSGQGSGTGETVTLTGTMTAATITHNDALAIPSGYDAIQSTYTSAANNVTVSTHFGWTSDFTVSGTDTQGNSYSLIVNPTFEHGDRYDFSATASDLSTNDVTGDVQFAMWLGENSGGHRISGVTRTFVAGEDAGFSISWGRTHSSGETAISTDEDLGFIIGVRPTSTGTLPTEPVVFSDLEFYGGLNQDYSGIVFTAFVPEPTSISLSLLGASSLLLRRRRF